MRWPKPAHKNADFDSRQTNFTQNGVTTIAQIKSAFIKFDSTIVLKNDIIIPLKGKITP